MVTPMQLVSDSFRWMEDSAGTWLCMKTSRPLAEQACEEAKDGKRYTVKITQERQKRSLDSNAYAWVLIGKLAEKLNLTPDEVYRQYVPDVAGNYTIVPVRDDMVEHWDRIWCSGHLGRMTKDMGPCRNLKGYRNIMSYLGSSDYDIKQMSRLIELIVADCKAQGIETLSEEKLAFMNEEWGGRYG